MNRKYNGHTLGFWVSFSATILCSLFMGSMVAQQHWGLAIFSGLWVVWWGTQMAKEAKKGGGE